MEDDGPEAARLDAIETALGLMFTRMRRDDAQAIVNDLRNLQRASRGDPEVDPSSQKALGRLAALLEDWARMPPRLRAEPGGAAPGAGDPT